MKGIPSGLRKHRVLILSMAVACLVSGCATTGGPTILSGGDYGATSGLGSNRSQRPTFHGGIDFAAAAGDPVLAAASGEVSAVFDDPKVVDFYAVGYTIRDWCGIGALVQHAANFSTLYCHLSSRAVQLGDHVARGQLIGGAGLTGFSANVVHLHFGVIEGGRAINPHRFLKAGCFDPGRTYPDPKAMTYPVRC
jgi:murein DD-endopeptidase MepM/ murein hydrolase activator NlpD